MLFITFEINMKFNFGSTEMLKTNSYKGNHHLDANEKSEMLRQIHPPPPPVQRMSTR